MPEDTYLDEVRSGKVEPLPALRQLLDELPSEASLERVCNVLRELGHDDAANGADKLAADAILVRLSVEMLARRQEQIEHAFAQYRLTQG